MLQNSVQFQVLFSGNRFPDTDVFQTWYQCSVRRSSDHCHGTSTDLYWQGHVQNAEKSHGELELQIRGVLRII